MFASASASETSDTPMFGAVRNRTVIVEAKVDVLGRQPFTDQSDGVELGGLGGELDLTLDLNHCSEFMFGRVNDMDLGPFGFAIERQPDDAHLIAAADIEKLGFTTLWMAGEIAAKAHEHRSAGADHIQLTILYRGDQPASSEAARQLAPLLFQGIS